MHASALFTGRFNTARLQQARPYARQKQPGRAPCDAQPGWESVIRRPTQSSHECGTPTALLDHRQHPGDERKGARAGSGVDLGHGRRRGSKSPGTTDDRAELISVPQIATILVGCI